MEPDIKENLWKVIIFLILNGILCSQSLDAADNSVSGIEPSTVLKSSGAAETKGNVLLTNSFERESSSVLSSSFDDLYSTSLFYKGSSDTYYSTKSIKKPLILGSVPSEVSTHIGLDPDDSSITSTDAYTIVLRPSFSSTVKYYFSSAFSIESIANSNAETTLVPTTKSFGPMGEESVSEGTVGSYYKTLQMVDSTPAFHSVWNTPRSLSFPTITDMPISSASGYNLGRYSTDSSSADPSDSLTDYMISSGFDSESVYKGLSNPMYTIRASVKYKTSLSTSMFYPDSDSISSGFELQSERPLGALSADASPKLPSVKHLNLLLTSSEIKTRYNTIIDGSSKSASTSVFYSSSENRIDAVLPIDSPAISASSVSVYKSYTDETVTDETLDSSVKSPLSRTSSVTAVKSISHSKYNVSDELLNFSTAHSSLSQAYEKPEKNSQIFSQINPIDTTASKDLMSKSDWFTKPSSILPAATLYTGNHYRSQPSALSADFNSVYVGGTLLSSTEKITVSASALFSHISKGKSIRSPLQLLPNTVSINLSATYSKVVSSSSIFNPIPISEMRTFIATASEIDSSFNSLPLPSSFVSKSHASASYHTESVLNSISPSPSQLIPTAIETDSIINSDSATCYPPLLSAFSSFQSDSPSCLLQSGTPTTGTHRGVSDKFSNVNPSLSLDFTIPDPSYLKLDASVAASYLIVSPIHSQFSLSFTSKSSNSLSHQLSTSPHRPYAAIVGSSSLNLNLVFSSELSSPIYTKSGSSTSTVSIKLLSENISTSLKSFHSYSSLQSIKPSSSVTFSSRDFISRSSFTPGIFTKMSLPYMSISHGNILLNPSEQLPSQIFTFSSLSFQSTYFLSPAYLSDSRLFISDSDSYLTSSHIDDSKIIVSETYTFESDSYRSPGIGTFTRSPYSQKQFSNTKTFIQSENVLVLKLNSDFVTKSEFTLSTKTFADGFWGSEFQTTVKGHASPLFTTPESLSQLYKSSSPNVYISTSDRSVGSRSVQQESLMSNYTSPYSTFYSSGVDTFIESSSTISSMTTILTTVADVSAHTKSIRLSVSPVDGTFIYSTDKPFAQSIFNPSTSSVIGVSSQKTMTVIVPSKVHVSAFDTDIFTNSTPVSTPHFLSSSPLNTLYKPISLEPSSVIQTSAGNSQMIEPISSFSLGAASKTVRFNTTYIHENPFSSVDIGTELPRSSTNVVSTDLSSNNIANKHTLSSMSYSTSRSEILIVTNTSAGTKLYLKSTLPTSSLATWTQSRTPSLSYSTPLNSSLKPFITLNHSATSESSFPTSSDTKTTKVFYSTAEISNIFTMPSEGASRAASNNSSSYTPKSVWSAHFSSNLPSLSTKPTIKTVSTLETITKSIGSSSAITTKADLGEVSSSQTLTNPNETNPTMSTVDSTITSVSSVHTNYQTGNSSPAITGRNNQPTSSTNEVKTSYLPNTKMSSSTVAVSKISSTSIQKTSQTASNKPGSYTPSSPRQAPFSSNRPSSSTKHTTDIVSTVTRITAATVPLAAGTTQTGITGTSNSHNLPNTNRISPSPTTRRTSGSISNNDSTIASVQTVHAFHSTGKHNSGPSIPFSYSASTGGSNQPTSSTTEIKASPSPNTKTTKVSSSTTAVSKKSSLSTKRTSQTVSNKSGSYTPSSPRQAPISSNRPSSSIKHTTDIISTVARATTATIPLAAGTTKTGITGTPNSQTLANLHRTSSSPTSRRSAGSISTTDSTITSVSTVHTFNVTSRPYPDVNSTIKTVTRSTGSSDSSLKADNVSTGSSQVSTNLSKTAVTSITDLTTDMMSTTESTTKSLSAVQSVYPTGRPNLAFVVYQLSFELRIPGGNYTEGLQTDEVFKQELANLLKRTIYAGVNGVSLTIYFGPGSIICQINSSLQLNTVNGGLSTLKEILNKNTELNKNNLTTSKGAIDSEDAATNIQSATVALLRNPCEHIVDKGACPEESVYNCSQSTCFHKCTQIPNLCGKNGVCYYYYPEHATACSCKKTSYTVYHGKRCEESTATQEFVLAVSLGIGGGLIFVLAAIIICLCVRRYREKKGQGRSFYSELDPHHEVASLRDLSFRSSYKGGGYGGIYRTPGHVNQAFEPMFSEGQTASRSQMYLPSGGPGKPNHRDGIDTQSSLYVDMDVGKEYSIVRPRVSQKAHKLFSENSSEVFLYNGRGTREASSTEIMTKL